MKVCSDWKRWTPQDYIQSQCKDAISRDVTSGNANLVIWCPSLKVENIELLRWHHLMLCRGSQSVLRFFRRQWHPVAGIYQTDWIRHSGQNNCCCVWTAWSSYSTTLYTTQLSDQHRHGVVKFSNVSGTSTTDSGQNWLNWPQLIVENAKPWMILLTTPDVVKFPNLSRTSTSNMVQKWWLNQP